MPRTFYTGPHTPWLDLSTWAAIESADATGALDETRWVEKKVALPPSNGASNLELARDCASLSRYGGLLVIGVHDKRGVLGTTDDPEAAKVRIIQVCAARISPPLYVDVTVVKAPTGSTPGPPTPPATPAPPEPAPHTSSTSPTDPAGPAGPAGPTGTTGTGPSASNPRAVVVVSVPASGSAPHMVDGKYWGRTDHGKTPLSDPEIAELMAARAQRQQINEHALEAIIDELGPIEDVPEFASMFTFIARPAGRAATELTTALAGKHPPQILNDAADFPAQWEPWSALGRHYRPHPSGFLFTSDSSPIGETGMWEFAYRLVLGDDGSIQALATGATRDFANPRTGSAPQLPARLGVSVGFVLEGVHRLCRLAGYVAAEHLAYWGEWDVGVRLTNLREVYASGVATGRRTGWSLHGFPTDGYVRVEHTQTRELYDAPNRVTTRLLERFLRSLGMENVCLPYERGEQIYERARG